MSTSAPPPAPQNPVDRRTFVRTTLDLGDVLLHPWGREAAELEVTLDGLAAAAADPLIALWNPLAISDRSDALAWLESRDGGWDRGDSASFAALAAADGALLGSVTLRWVDRADSLAMIGYWTVPAARGRSVATRATRAVTSWAFGTADARRIEIAHAVGNEASCRVAHRCGYLPEGTLRDSHRFGDGAYYDEHLHARLATDPESADLVGEPTAYGNPTAGRAGDAS
ncbi:GNAT family N-acetyltransferase [Streptomyces lunaelactis]|uniref:GNAT family N-acetyltransferase n=4 Tax=Streptomyces lunaelactis TaxID=1535768 RepID=UPI0015846F1E|nr:GNAT family protein [Streptomyces lunaelactis]NUK25742.1 GNAT family N-acetyltransferase [Streptomyces lunaelactis]NUK32430.1 GNAT family N-acetyltransferase [Streptomyces lunaelactis]NUK39447.1 GNAT family N-acetyltransferase [Streptomyces lunaelactis]NUK50994.1 GNAT family N-acetyltransferase [Streptomyces lunaelactis]NUK62766.1 GNAT family N-acetyltransferase [Streptomyces lunaelactis]